MIYKWYMPDVSAIDPTPLALTFTTVADALGSSTLPAGHWNVDIFLDDNQVGEQIFSIQQ